MTKNEKNKNFVTYKHVALARSGDHVWIVTLNNPPLNTSSTPLRAALMDAITACQGDAIAVIMHGAGRAFMAGGDMSEFDAPPAEPHLPDLCAAIEGAPLPWIAAIHGACLGGGFELALSCAFRVASGTARFGLPEVSVGLIPGAGGTQRLPRLLGMEAALELLTTGKLIDASRLNALGGLDVLVDDADDSDDIVAAARAFAQNLPKPPTPTSERPIGTFDADMIKRARKKLTPRSEGPEAPLWNLEALSWAKLPFDEAQPKERALHLELRQSAEARALRHAFFSERAVMRPKVIENVTPRKIQEIAVVGGGLMGSGIIMSALMSGLRVTLLEQDDEAAESGRNRVLRLIEGGVTRGKIDEEKRRKMEAALKTSSDYGAASNADLAIEAVFEDLSIKQSVFGKLNKVMDSHAILATNTSYLDPREIFSGLPNPSRLIGLHFFSPAHIMKLLEIVELPSTSPEVLASGFALGKMMGKISVRSGICDGFIGNRMLAAYRRQADYLLMDGAYPAQVDHAMRAFGWPKGPYELQDMTGLQIAWANRKRQEKTRAPSERYVDIGDKLCEAKRFGARAGAGWYKYDADQKEPIADDDVTNLIEDASKKAGITRQEFSEEDIQARIMAAMINEGFLIIEEGIAERELDVDQVQIHGYGFPRWRGGPLHYARGVGLDKIKADFEAIAAQSPNSWKQSQSLR